MAAATDDKKDLESSYHDDDAADNQADMDAGVHNQADMDAGVDSHAGAYYCRRHHENSIQTLKTRSEIRKRIQLMLLQMTIL